MRLLIVEDDDRIASHLVRGLSESGYVVDRVADGELGLAMAKEQIYDALIVDRLLPGMDGISLVRALRQYHATVPVLMLSALANPLDRVEGLRAGCDDYLGKPYAFAELLARLQALARRNNHLAEQSILRVSDLELDTEKRTVTRGGKTIALQFREFLLLQTLMKHADSVVTRSMLIEAAWDYAFEPRGNIVDMHIHRLRQKVDSGFAVPLIRTVTGAGYILTASDRGT
ncbi:MAG: DNA-binding response regulator [Rhizobium sp.]|nr:DNA-binding response regulator [Rhizobium sp.]